MIAVGRAAATGSETTQIARPSPPGAISPATANEAQGLERQDSSLVRSSSRQSASARRQIPHGDGLDPLGAQALHCIAVDARKQPTLPPFLRFGSRREMSAQGKTLALEGGKRRGDIAGRKTERRPSASSGLD